MATSLASRWASFPCLGTSSQLDFYTHTCTSTSVTEKHDFSSFQEGKILLLLEHISPWDLRTTSEHCLSYPQHILSERWDPDRKGQAVWPLQSCFWVSPLQNPEQTKFFLDLRPCPFWILDLPLPLPWKSTILSLLCLSVTHFFGKIWSL